MTPRSAEPDAGIARLVNALTDEEAAAALRRCCGSRRWVERMLAGRPYASDAALFSASQRVWQALERADWLEAFATHPRIGERAADVWARGEQSGMDAASVEARRAFADGNQVYEDRFGHVFLICATGRSAADMLAELQFRLGNDPRRELHIAAEEQAKITRLRLEKLVAS